MQYVYSVNAVAAEMCWSVQWQILFSELSTSTYCNIKKYRTSRSGHDILQTYGVSRQAKRNRHGCSCTERNTKAFQSCNHRKTICTREGQSYFAMRRKLMVFKESYNRATDER
jgi:hypothetical protein